jgi:hypothetical protein
MFGPVFDVSERESRLMFQIDTPEMYSGQLSRYSLAEQEDIRRLYPLTPNKVYSARKSGFCQFMGDQLFNQPSRRSVSLLVESYQSLTRSATSP